MIIEPPKTVLDFKRVEESILEMMHNPYCDMTTYVLLEKELKKCRTKIEQLKCECKYATFTRVVTDDYEMQCGKCWKPI